MQIDFAGKITRDEFLRASKVIFARYRKAFRWIIGVSLLILFLYLAPYLIDHKSFSGQLQYMIGPILFLVTILFYYFFQPYLAARRMNHPSNPYKDHVSGYLSEDELVFCYTNSKSNLLWKGFTNFVLKHDVLILYRSNTSVILLTKSMFTSPEDWDNCLALVKSKIPNQ